MSPFVRRRHLVSNEAVSLARKTEADGACLLQELLSPVVAEFSCIRGLQHDKPRSKTHKQIHKKLGTVVHLLLRDRLPIK